MAILHRETAKIILVHGQSILLCNAAGEPIFHLPGGGLEGRETPEQALRRELKEEIWLPLAWCSPVTELTASWQPFGDLKNVVHEKMHLFAGQLTHMGPERISRHEKNLNLMWMPLTHVMPCQGPQFQVRPVEVLQWLVRVGGQLEYGGYGR